ncbi:MAG: hypothetical protein ACQSGP_31750 [Frankia sp.]
MTTLAERLPDAPPAAARTDEAELAARGGERAVIRLLTLSLAFNIFGMRLGLPLSTSGVPLLLPVVYGVVIYLRLRGELVLSAHRTMGYLAAMAACTFAAYLSFARGRSDTSFTSLMLLVATYAPFCFGLRPDRKALFNRVLGRFVTLTTVLAWLAVGQIALQLAGWKYSDLLGSVVPHSFLLQNFNTSYPVQYGASLYKANGFFCLEPSYCSQYLALGLVAYIVRGAHWRKVVLYILAILATVSGTGLLLLAGAMVVVSVRRGPRFAASVVLLVGIVALAISFTPAAAPFKKRLTETSSSQSSGSLRFVQPYSRMWDELGKDPASVAFGEGSGFADRDATTFFEDTGLPLNYAMIPKLVIEYGVVGCLIFLIFLYSAFTRGSPSTELSGATIVFVTILSGSLLSPTVMYTPLVLIVWFAHDRDAGVDRSSILAHPPAA